MGTEIRCINEKEALFNRHIIYDGGMWGFLSMTDDLVRLDMESWEMSYVRMENEDNNKILAGLVRGTDGLICEKDIIYRIDFNAQGIYQYHLTEKTYEYIKFDFHRQWGENVAAIFSNKKYIYFFMNGNGAVYQLNLTTGNVTVTDKISRLLGQDVFLSNGIQIDNSVWLFSRKTPRVITYDMDTDHCECYDLPECVKGCIDMMFYEGVFWVLDTNNRILTWNPVTGKGRILWEDNQWKVSDYFAKMVVTEKTIYLLPALGKDILRFDKQSMTFSKLDEYPEDFNYVAYDNWSKYLGYSDYKMVRYFSMRSANYILGINLKTGHLRWIKPKRPTEIEKWLYYADTRENIVIAEQDAFLRYYISLVTRQMEKRHTGEITNGKSIYNRSIEV